MDKDGGVLVQWELSYEIMQEETSENDSCGETTTT